MHNYKNFTHTHAHIHVKNTCTYQYIHIDIQIHSVIHEHIKKIFDQDRKSGSA